MKPRILLVNPPIYDFSAYDFWLKPYGMLSVAGAIQQHADLTCFDYLDRLHGSLENIKSLKSTPFGKGKFPEQIIPLPKCLAEIPRYYRRFGLKKNLFHEFLAALKEFDYALIQTTMTYWYPGVNETIRDIRKYQPKAKIILGGNYATLCPDHAKALGVDLVIKGTNLKPLWDMLNIKPDLTLPALWQIYPKLKTAALKLSDGCPFSCTYCSVPKVYGKFSKRPLQKAIEETELLVKKGVTDIAFYDDALLCEANQTLLPFLDAIQSKAINVNFHSPNALNARLITATIAKQMVAGGFKTFYLGFESKNDEFQNLTGSKVCSDDLAAAVDYLAQAGADKKNITAYQILGHPRFNIQHLEETMYFVHSLGIRGMLADFSPIPGTPDGDYCSKFVDMSEPLMHNKTAFPIIAFGFKETNRLKDLQRKLNRSLP